MLTILGDKPRRESSRFCDGLRRREFLKIGGLALGGLSLPQLLRAETAAGVNNSHKGIIMIFLPGGPPHQDMWDIKTDAPAEIQGRVSADRNERPRHPDWRDVPADRIDDAEVRPNSLNCRL